MIETSGDEVEVMAFLFPYLFVLTIVIIHKENFKEKNTWNLKEVSKQERELKKINHNITWMRENISKFKNQLNAKIHTGLTSIPRRVQIQILEGNNLTIVKNQNDIFQAK